MSIYIQEGYKSRRDYLDTLAADYGLPTATVYALAGILGSSEDFDGLICALEDAADELSEADE